MEYIETVFIPLLNLAWYLLCIFAD